MSADQPSINKSNSPDSIIHPPIQQRDKNESAIRLLDSWLERGDEKEQKET